MKGRRKDLIAAVRELLRQGWVLEHSRHGHHHLRHPNAVGKLTVSSTPRCRYAAEQLRRDAARALQGAPR